jgi:hypothetical protein
LTFSPWPFSVGSTMNLRNADSRSDREELA